MGCFDGSVGDTKLGRGKTGVKAISWGQWNTSEERRRGCRLWCQRDTKRLKESLRVNQCCSLMWRMSRGEDFWWGHLGSRVKETVRLPWYQFGELEVQGAWKLSNGVFRKYWVLSSKFKIQVCGSSIHSLNKHPLMKTACFFKSNKGLVSQDKKLQLFL